MSPGLIKYKSLLLNYLDEYYIMIFRLEVLKTHFGEQYPSIFRALKSLIHEGVLLRIQKGLYCRPGFSDQNVLAYHLAPNGAIAYWSALHFHGLTDQFPHTVFVQSPTLIRNKTVMGIPFHFVKILKAKIDQIEIHGRGNAQFAVVSVEKSLVDCFDQIQYSGGWDLGVSAFLQATIRQKSLKKACNVVNNISVTKRLGYLAELTNKVGMTSFIKYAHSHVNEKYSLLDPSGEDIGPFDNNWRLRINVPLAEITEMIDNPY